MLRVACLQHRHQRCHRRVRHKPIVAALWRYLPLVPCLDRRRHHLRLPVLPSVALAMIINGKRRCGSPKSSALEPAPFRLAAVALSAAIPNGACRGRDCVESSC